MSAFGAAIGEAARPISVRRCQIVSCGRGGGFQTRHPVRRKYLALIDL